MPDASSPDRPTSDLTRHTLKGLQWAYLGSAVGGVLQFGMAAALARLLAPSAFGLIALANLFLRFVDYFAKAGVTQAVIQKPTLSPTDIRAAFTLSAGLAAGFSALVFSLSPLAGRIVGEPDLPPVLRWLALGLLLQGLGATSIALLRRSLRFKHLAMIEVGSYSIGYIGVGLAMAVGGAGVYALVGAMLTQVSIKALSAYAVVQHPLLPTASRSSHRAILSFGARISVVGFFEFLRSNLDTLAVGRWAGATQLGFYNRSRLLAELPSYQLMQGLSQVLFPSFSAIQADRERLLKAYLSAVGAAAAIVLPMNAGMAVAAREIILVVLGPQWQPAIEVLPWLLLVSAVALTGHFAGVVAEAQAALNAKIAISVGSTGMLAALLFVAHGRSLSAYGAALAATTLAAHVSYVSLISRTLETPLRVLLRPYGPALLASIAVAVAIGTSRILLLQYEMTLTLPLVLILEVVVGAITLGAVFRIGPLSTVRRDLAQRLHDSNLMDSGSSGLRRVVALMLGEP
jgi:lipopolysaccharide exporter